jgi:hypothetical protein
MCTQLLSMTQEPHEPNWLPKGRSGYFLDHLTVTVVHHRPMTAPVLFWQWRMSMGKCGWQPCVACSLSLQEWARREWCLEGCKGQRR